MEQGGNGRSRGDLMGGEEETRSRRSIEANRRSSETIEEKKKVGAGANRMSNEAI